MRRQIIVSLILVAGLLASGLGITVLLVVTRPQPPTRDTSRPPLLVKAVTVRPQTVTEPIIGYGTARADRFARLSAQVAGEIVELQDWLKPGAQVRQGQLLLCIDEQEYARMLEGAEGRLDAERAQGAQLEVEEQSVEQLIVIAKKELDIAQTDYDRIKVLYEAGESHPREHDQYHRALQQARSAWQVLQNRKALIPARRAQIEANVKERLAEVQLARLRVDRCRIAAPFDGRIDEVRVELGERIQIGQELVTLLNPDLIEIPIELPASIRHRIELGAACRMSVDAAENLAWEGRVQRMSPTASETTRTFRLYVEVDNAEQDRPLVPGFFVLATIDGPTLADALIVPRGAIQEGRLFIYNDGHAYPRDVRVVRHLVDQSVVTGLQPGDTVITSNLDVLYEGAAVRIDGAQAATPTPAEGDLTHHSLDPMRHAGTPQP